jgi:hypothetical protein
MINNAAFADAKLDPAGFTTSNWDQLSAATTKLFGTSGGKIQRIGFDPKIPEFLDQFGQAGESAWEVVLAGAVITTVPMIIAFFLCQRYFVEGVATQGRKG